MLLHIQTASIYGRSITAENKTTLKSVTSSIVLSSFLQSSNHHSMFTERLSNIRMKNGSNRHGLRSFNSHLTHFATSVWLNGITQQTTMCGCSVPATVTLSQPNNQIPTERKTETSLSKKVSPTRDKRAPEKGMRSAKVTAPESQWFTHSPTVLEYTEKSYFSNLYGSVYTTRASFTQHRNGTAMIVQAGTAYQTRLSTPFYSEAHQLLSSLNPGSRESYQTNIFGNNSLTPATQLSATHQITITSTGAVAATKLRTSPNSVPYEAHSSYFCHKTSPDSFTSSSSQTSNTRQRKKIPESRQRSPMLSIDLNTSSFAKGEYSSSWFSNSLFNHSMVQPTLKLTKFHINSRTTSKNVSRTVNFIHGPTLITTTQIPISKSYGKTTSSYLKFDLSTSWKSDYHSSIKRTDNGRQKVNFSVLHATDLWSLIPSSNKNTGVGASLKNGKYCCLIRPVQQNTQYAKQQLQTTQI